MKTYYAVIFTSQRTDEDGQGYAKMAEMMDKLAQKQPGFLRVESVRNAEGKGITVSYWESLEAIQAWKDNSKHLVAQQFGKEKWYMQYSVEICTVIKDYSFIM
ncbi:MULTISPECIES: antibiotic biosynthesis monooxygenase [unclassified Lysinibacillus]|uniref:antibiotic biosynthesis monooxygenase family protein n=1 Tax=unclassified Lysinibacillus TaxID=2636778 RepID=UPI00200EB517|nr:MULTISPECIES: antibiotic biosynthesis monooxygenase [unclassified Lysinibacillus]MDD1505027.1 antibiotic biosynthesis monooxygenase [Lysinibacillus sp. CNPSo 3705]UPW81574.1 antibiotic biosynthesis monooxygenase [Lysinibacillus sp. Ag94]